MNKNKFIHNLYILLFIVAPFLSIAQVITVNGSAVNQFGNSFIPGVAPPAGFTCAAAASAVGYYTGGTCNSTCVGGTSTGAVSTDTTLFNAPVAGLCTTHRLTEFRCRIRHSWNSDVWLWLRNPIGQSAVLRANSGGAGTFTYDTLRTLLCDTFAIASPAPFSGGYGTPVNNNLCWV